MNIMSIISAAHLSPNVENFLGVSFRLFAPLASQTGLELPQLCLLRAVVSILHL